MLKTQLNPEKSVTALNEWACGCMTTAGKDTSAVFAEFLLEACHPSAGDLWMVCNYRQITDDTPKRAAEWVDFLAFRNGSRESLLSTNLLLNALPWTWFSYLRMHDILVPYRLSLIIIKKSINIGWFEIYLCALIFLIFTLSMTN